LLVPFSHIELDGGVVGFNFSISESAVCTTKEIYTLVELPEAISNNGRGSLPCRTLQRFDPHVMMNERCRRYTHNA
jgi:hypothetical protein